MKRYQVYLNPHHVSVLDDIEKISNISRSKLLRLLVDRAADQAVEILTTVIERKELNKSMRIMDSLAGFVDLKTKKKTNFAQNVDKIYFSD